MKRTVILLLCALATLLLLTGAAGAFSPRLDRLELLAAKLDWVDPAQWDITRFGNERLATAEGFIGNAEGWATAVPLIWNEGYRLKVWDSAASYRKNRRPERVIPHTTVTFDGQEGRAATEWYFGLSSREAHELFSMSSYSDLEQRNPKATAQRIRAFIAKRSNKP